MEPERRSVRSKELDRVERKSKIFMASVIALVALGVALGVCLHR
ncbi:MAG TPA: hypothetical protein VMG32_03710 [Anaeromyxobacteraceae bacterium]|nr:hypothetical protein [Anaeromyxobacteraceae bacterium]